MDIRQLPEGCVSLIISLTSPRDACRSSAVSPMFRSASESDSVWEKFLPCDYEQFVSQSREFPAQILNSMPNKKSLYLHLCDNPIIIGDGNMSFSLDKPTGKKCFMVGARRLSIVWGETPEYWKWKSLPESRFTEVANLKMVWWLHAYANFETRALSPRMTYVAYLVFKLSQRWSRFRDEPVELHVHFEGRDQDGGAIRALLSRDHGQEVDRSGNDPDRPFLLRERRDGWTEIKMGDFFNESREDGNVLCNLREFSCSRFWSGLTIEGIEFRPKSGI